MSYDLGEQLLVEEPRAEAYEPPALEDVETGDGSAVTSAGADGTGI
jgi:hypothetical protein